MEAYGLDPGSLSSLARGLYANERNAKIRITQSYRSYICPLGSVIDQVPPGSRVLDVGCGAGLLLLLMARLGRIAAGSGFDVSADAITAANAVAKREGFDRQLRFATRSIEAGIPREDCNVITVVDVLHHVPRPAQERFVADLCAAVPAGGRLVIKDMVAAPLWRSVANQLHDLVMARQLVRHVDPATVERWAQSSGFAVVGRAHANTLWYGHWLLVLERAR